MTELENIVAAVTEYLNSAADTAVCAYPVHKMPGYNVPVTAVGIADGEAVQSGFGEYLGIYSDPENGERELYGKRMDITLSLYVYSPKTEEYGVSGCHKTFGEIVKAMEKAPFPINVRELACGETGYDSDTGMFLCRCSMKCSCWLTAEMLDDGIFTDFKLQGVMI